MRFLGSFNYSYTPDVVIRTTRYEDTNQNISEYYLFVQKTLLWYGGKGDKLKPWLARKCIKLSWKFGNYYE